MIKVSDEVALWALRKTAEKHMSVSRLMGEMLSEDFQAGRRYGDVEVVKPFERSPSGRRTPPRHVILLKVNTADPSRRSDSGFFDFSVDNLLATF